MIRVNKVRRKKVISYSIPFKLQVLERIRQGEMSINKAGYKYKIGGHNTIYKWMKRYDELFEEFEKMTKNSPPLEQDLKASEFRKMQKRVELLEYVIDKMQEKIKEHGGEALLKKFPTQYLNKSKKSTEK